MRSSDSTSLTLLAVLRQPNAPPERWLEFFRLYTPLLMGWARQLGVQEDDACDITQETLVAVSKGIATFTHTPGNTFRGWLYTIACNKFRDVGRRKQRYREVSLNHGDEPAVELGGVLGEEQDYRVVLVRRACEIIRPEFEERTWQAFVRCKLGGEIAGEVAFDLGMRRQAVYASCSRVLVRLRSVVADFIQSESLEI
jgi:RNA polymerase sigma-70 factor, ECF subfamily